MSSFSALLSSLQDGKAREGDAAPVATIRPAISTVTQRPTVAVTGKRKLDDEPIAARKAAKLDPSPPINSNHSSALTKTESSGLTRPAPILGSMKSKADPIALASKPASAKPQQNGIAHSSTSSRPSQTAAPAGPAPAKRGFASLLAKAAAAQEAIKKAGPATIKHKPTEVMKKKERERLRQAAKEDGKRLRTGGLKSSASKMNGARNTGLVRNVDGKPARRPKDDLSSIGTMRAKADTKATQTLKQKGLGQDKYGGYASWSDLDAEDDEQDYDSGSDMEEAGFDDIMEEDRQAERMARLEDQRELELEERRRKEKLERKQKLMALSDSAAAVKKRY